LEAAAASIRNGVGPQEGKTETILDLLGLIYDAAGDASHWPAFLEALLRAINASKGTLALRDSKHTEFAFACWRGWSNEDIQLYGEQYAESDPWRIAAARWPEGAVGTDFEICPRKEMEASAAFQEFYAPRDAIHGLGATILVTGAGQSLIIACRDAGAGPSERLRKQSCRP
jgi:hypothetical protein